MVSSDRGGGGGGGGDAGAGSGAGAGAGEGCVEKLLTRLRSVRYPDSGTWGLGMARPDVSGILPDSAGGGSSDSGGGGDGAAAAAGGASGGGGGGTGESWSSSLLEKCSSGGAGTHSLSLPTLQLPSLSSLESKVDDYFEQNVYPFMSQNYYAICAGAMLGTAVTMGMLVGAVAAAGAVYGTSVFGAMGLPSRLVRGFARRKRRESESEAAPSDASPYSGTRGEAASTENLAGSDGESPETAAADGEVKSSGVTRPNGRRERGQSSSEQEGAERGNRPSSLEGDAQEVSCVWVEEGGIMVLRGDPRPLPRAGIRTQTSAVDQYRECLDSIGVLLGKNSLGWHHVRKMTVYLVSGECDPSEFRSVRGEYPSPPQGGALTTIVFVQRLEQEHALVQVEVMACSR